MFVIIGYVVVIAFVFGVYAATGGNMAVVAHAAPHELAIILGAAIGAFLVANPAKTLKAVLAALPKLFQGSKHTKARYMALMALLYDILTKVRKEGMMAIESDIEDPAKSPLFQKHPTVASDHHLVEFICDYLRMMVSGNMNPLEIESLMDQEIETHHHEGMVPAHALQTMGDGLPAFGIVAAVLGVVKTMASVGKPPAELGAMIASALVGTFLGILLAYGFVSPLAKLLEAKCDESTKELQCVKATLLASLQGYAPAVAVEFGRKVLYSSDRPSFAELEKHVKQKR
ncbi:MAG: flagellar motor stator protein MotA [Sutterellaceae bacterium]|nr:flagellar motor stator protein MotA [Burkholderiaceae bacterium]MDW8431025.1 flagellar motor stator protein MotA [Sutterellaceae bacterium]